MNISSRSVAVRLSFATDLNTDSCVRRGLGLVAGVLLAWAGTTVSASDYRIEVVAESGAGGINTISGAPSINDHGEVAFGAFVTGGESLFVADGIRVANITPGFVSSTRSFSPVLQINNDHRVGARDRVSGAPPTFLERRWNAAVADSSTVVALSASVGFCTGGLNAGQACTDNGDCPPNPNTGETGFCDKDGSGYDSFVFSALNNHGRMAFLGLLGVNTYLITASGLSDFSRRSVGGSFRPMIADNDAVVGREGNTPTSPVRMYLPGLLGLNVEDVATSPNYSELGSSPGISDDGRVVGFGADRGDGRGVFISFEYPAGTRQVVAVAGENNSPRPELGQIDPSTPLYFSQIEIDSRVAVMISPAGNPGIEDDQVLVCFVATPNLAGTNVAVGAQRLSFRATRGVWTVRGTLRTNATDTLEFQRERVSPVLQHGDAVDPGGTQAIDNLSIHDPLGAMSIEPGSVKSHRVALLATSAGRQFVVRAVSCGCAEPTEARPVDVHIVSDTEAHGWKMTIHVSDDDGLVLRDVRLAGRYMARQISLPYFTLQTSAFGAGGTPVRCELAPDGGAGPARSRLVGFTHELDPGSSDTRRPYVIEARYQVDQIGQSCLEVTQKYLFYPLNLDDPVELSGTFKAQRFFPLVSYSFCPVAGETLTSIEFAQRMHFQVDGMPANNAAFFRDEAIPTLVDYPPYLDVVTVGANPRTLELWEPVVFNGAAVDDASDSIHQTFNVEVDEPAPSGLRPAGCVECLHSHWRWPGIGDVLIRLLKKLGFDETPGYSRGGFLRYPFKTIPFDGEPILPTTDRGFPADSAQSISIAAVLAGGDEEDATDVSTIAARRRDLVSADQAFWYVARSQSNEDTINVHGGFFSPTLFGAHVTPLFEVNRDASFVTVNGLKEITLNFRNISRSTVDGPVYLMLKGSETFNLDNADGYEVVAWPRNVLTTLLDDLAPIVRAAVLIAGAFSEKPPVVVLEAAAAGVSPGGVRSKTLRFKETPQGFPAAADVFKIYAGKVTGLPFNPGGFLPTMVVTPSRLLPRAGGGAPANAGDIELTVVGPTGFSYYPTNSVLRVDFSTNLVNWQLVREIAPTEAVTVFSEPLGLSVPARFYRVIWQGMP